MKFIHVTDTHLGKTELRLREREKDFYDSFKQVIDRAIKEKVDFVVHAGDFFDVARPPTRTLIFAVEQLIRLKNENIPIYIVAGSHDIGVEDTMLSVLEAMGLLHHLSSGRYYKPEGDKLIIDGEMFGDAFICGLPGRRANINSIYEKLVPARKGKYNIFVFHHIISDISEKFADITTSMLPKGFDYYASGHWHGYFETKFDDGLVIYPGATDFNDLTEMENSPERYFCLVNVDDGKTTFEKVKINTRPISSVTIDCNSLDAQEVLNKTLKSIPNNEEGAILIIKLEGKLSKGTKSEIDRAQIMNFAREKGYLYSKIYISDLENPESPFVSSKKRTAEDIEEEYLKKQKYDANSLKVAKEMIRLLGKKLSPSEIKNRQNAAIELIRGNLIENNES